MSTLVAPATSFVRRRPLTAFFLWFFTVGQAIAFVPVVRPVPYPQVFVDLSTLVGLLLPALVVTRVVGGPVALRALLRAAFVWRVGPRWYGLALVVVPAVAVAVAVAVSGAPDAARAGLVAGFAVQLLLAFVLNNWWEEVAWAGFVGARMQERFGSTLRAALVAGPLFALQHGSGVVGEGLVGGALLLVVLSLLTTPFRMLTGWMWNRTGSVLVIGLLHAAGNAAGPGSGFGPGLLARLYPDAAVSGVAHIVGIALVGLVVLTVTRGRLGDRRRPDVGSR